MKISKGGPGRPLQSVRVASGTGIASELSTDNPDKRKCGRQMIEKKQ